MIVSVSFGSVKSLPSMIIVNDLSDSGGFDVIKRVGEFGFVKLVDERVIYFNGDARFDVLFFIILSNSEVSVDEVREFVGLLRESGKVRVNCPPDFDVDELKLRFESLKLYSEGLVNLSAGEPDVLSVVEGRVIVNNLLLMSEFGCADGLDDIVSEFNRLLRKGSFEFLTV